MNNIIKTISDLLFGKSELSDPKDAPPPPPPQPTPQPTSTGEKPAPVHPKVLAIIHNPVMPTHGGRKIKDVYRWQDPDTLMKGYTEDITRASHGYANFQIVERLEVDSFPLKKDGFRYTPMSFDNAWNKKSFHQPDAVDYLEIVKEFDIIDKIDSGKIDEVWLMGFPYCGYYESIMCGPGAFWCNAPPLQGTQHASRRFVIMGFNYERGVGEMLENLGHRTESIIGKVYAHTKGDANLWERFIRYDKKTPGLAECGNVHFAPNSQRDYDWGNKTPVQTRCDNWLKFPDLSDPPTIKTCAEWGDGDIRKHHVWWLSHLPHIAGEADGVSWNWWEYVIDPNRA